MSRTIIIGAGAGGKALLPILNEYQEINIMGIADISSDAPGIKIAKELGIPTYSCYKELLSVTEPEVIVNVTGNKQISKELHAIKKDGTEVLEGLSAKLLFKLVDERRKREMEISRSLQEQQILYEIGIMLTSSEKEEEMLTNIVKCAMQLTDTPAGSITLYDEVKGFMEMVAFSGFSENFSTKTKWDLRKGGLTDHILNQNKTVVINDIAEAGEMYAEALMKEGIKSLLATPLVADRKTIGILYVDDFKMREFTKREESVLALLATQAALAIEKLQLLEKTKKLAITDELTSLYNHRYFVNILKDELVRSKRYDRALSVILIDIDNFKHYNDTHGHLKGNQALKNVSKVMSKSIRDIDVLARYGGEEFAVILPEADKQMALECAERIRMAVEEEPFDGEDKQPLGNLTISAGLATFPEDAKRESSLINRADKALYQAKREGRNRVVMS